MHDPSAGHKYKITTCKKRPRAYTFKEENGIGWLQLAAGTSHFKYVRKETITSDGW